MDLLTDSIPWDPEAAPHEGEAALDQIVLWQNYLEAIGGHFLKVKEVLPGVVECEISKGSHCGYSASLDMDRIVDGTIIERLIRDNQLTF